MAQGDLTAYTFGALGFVAGALLTAYLLALIYRDLHGRWRQHITPRLELIYDRALAYRARQKGRQT
jgi:hypothetical protein